MLHVSTPSLIWINYIDWYSYVSAGYKMFLCVIKKDPTWELINFTEVPCWLFEKPGRK